MLDIAALLFGLFGVLTLHFYVIKPVLKMLFPKFYNMVERV